MTTQLPNPGLQSPDDHMAISVRFLEHARLEIAKNPPNRLQASEKIWGAVAHALSSIAEQRGWLHHHHTDFYDIANYLAKEYGRPELVSQVTNADSFHVNFYGNRRRSDEIRAGIDAAEKFVAELQDLGSRPMGYYKIENGSERARVHNLTGESIPIGTEREEGFVNGNRLARLSP